MNVNKHLSFRVWNVVTNEFEYPQEGVRQYLMDMNGEIFDGNGCRYDEQHEAFRVSGIFDDYGDHVYEGDIIEYYNGEGFGQTGPYVVEVQFIDRGWHFAEEGFSASPAYQPVSVRVIGNIKEGVHDD
jgi:hypothetical protein